jgi:drug/metabolite transporter (DMT)-like permease
VSPGALALVVSAALLHALWNVAAKHVGAGRHFQLLCALLIVPLWAPAAWWAGLPRIGGFGAAAWACIAASGVLHWIYFRCLLRGYRESDLTVVYPVARGTGPLLSSLGAMLWLAEAPTPSTLVGVAAVCAGIVLIAGGPALWRPGQAPGQRERLHAGLRWGAWTGVLIASYTLVDGVAVKRLAMAPVLLDYVGNLCRLPLMLPSALREPAALRAQWRQQWKHALVVAAISPLGYILVLQALTSAPLSHVAPAREVSMLFAALLGGQLLGERHRGMRLLGAACMALGVAALAWG